MIIDNTIIWAINNLKGRVAQNEYKITRLIKG